MIRGMVGVDDLAADVGGQDLAAERRDGAGQAAVAAAGVEHLLAGERLGGQVDVAQELLAPLLDARAPRAVLEVEVRPFVAEALADRVGGVPTLLEQVVRRQPRYARGDREGVP